MYAIRSYYDEGERQGEEADDEDDDGRPVVDGGAQGLAVGAVQEVQGLAEGSVRRREGSVPDRPFLPRRQRQVSYNFV